MNKLCDVCGTKPANLSIGSAMACRACEPDMQEAIAKVRKAGKPVNAIHIAKKLYRDQYAGGHFLLRDVPEELYRRTKQRALDEQCSVRELVLKSVIEYLEK